MQHEQHRVPVTALAFWREDVILSGEGGILKAYDIQSKTLLASASAFEGQAIHGIIFWERQEGKVLVWGGRRLRVAQICSDATSSYTFRFGCVAEAGDWILDAACSGPASSGLSMIAIVTAHSALSTAVVGAALGLVIEPVVAGSNCILYAAHVIWLSPLKCLIASGTAFGDIVVWSSEISDQGGKLSATWQTHYEFSAHDGSVYGVHFSTKHVASALGASAHILASCSDDRTIRLWDVSDLSQQITTAVSEQRETGFGARSSREAHTPPCIFKMMGHISRIWHVRFIDGPSTDGFDAGSVSPVRLISFGEDATCVTWSLDRKSSLAPHTPPSARQLSAHKDHDGKNIWSVAISEKSGVATGAADGDISFRRVTETSNSDHRLISVDAASPNQARLDSIRSYCFISGREVLAISDRGKVLLLTLGSSTSSHCRELSLGLDALRGYSIATSSKGIAFFAGISGHVHVYDPRGDRCYEIARTEGKVVGIWSHPLSYTNGTGFALLVSNIGRTHARYYRLTANQDNGYMATTTQSQLGFPDSNFVVTSSVQLILGDRDWTVLGSRSGSIAIYEHSNHSDEEILIPSCCIAVHGKEAVTSLMVSYTPQASSTTTYVFSTGRDGTYALHGIRIDDNAIHFTTVHQLSLPFGPNIEGVGYSSEGEDKHIGVWGFKSKSFIFFDITSQREVMNVECGGVHRSWSFQPDMLEKGGGGTFLWTKASSLYHSHRSNLRPFDSLHHGGHGREIKAMAVAPPKRMKCGSSMIATGAEDTNIKLSVHADALDGSSCWRCLHTLQKHNTGIQHLWFSRDGSYLLSSAGFEEFFVWRVNYDVPSELHVGVLCESTHPRSGTSDLRIMNFDVEEGEVSDGNSKEEGGGKSCSTVPLFRITMVYSNSTMNTWQYHDRSWKLLATGNYLTSCLTQCLYVGRGAGSRKVLTASTDGHTATWKVETSSNSQETMRWTRSSRHKVHQNAILAMLVHPISDLLHLVVTGGDDNALAFSLGTTDDTNADFTSLLVPRAHSAAVTALAIVKTALNCVWLVTASIDQRIKLWQIHVDGNTTLHNKATVDGIQVQLLQNKFTAVADVSSMEPILLDHGQTGIILCGVGMDLWRVQL